ncbi:MAG TPA: hypothetical protein VFA94_05295 [Acidimicrobiales bacterium]|nr:hypothetical protein [Acidimicrobiales bacterium]
MPSQILLRGLDGGLLVVAFAVLGHVLRPKRFAGLTSAAPSIALANLVVTAVVKGPGDVADSCLGMVAGAAGFVAFAALVRPLLPRLGAVWGSVVACAAWAAVACAGYGVVAR